ncbi:MAG: ribosomal RNA small subunit methyltransferase A [Desulfurococcales archaeon]|nr:ribosomal RNA small subunit methyltransferase A [Desulfurococcales archaeon]
MKAALSKLRRELRLLKREGQHLMKDCGIGEAFISALEGLRPKSCVEIGAGLGFLTRFIRRSCSNVIAVELDLRLLPYLKGYVSDLLNVHIVGGDGLHIISGGHLCDTIVSNTPYKITGPLIAGIVKSAAKAAAIMVQQEVADRLTSPPGDRKYGRLTAFVNSFMSVERVRTFPPESFFPRPKVNSTLIVLKRFREWSPSMLGYERFLRDLFTQRRKVLGKVLRETFHCVKTDVADDIRKLRVYQLSPPQLLKIYDDLLRSGKC